MPRTFKNVIFTFRLTLFYVCSQIIICCRLAHLTGAFKIILIYCCVLWDLIRRISSYVLDPFPLQRANKWTSFRKYKPVRSIQSGSGITLKEHLLIWNSETTHNLNIYFYNYQTAISLATKHEKKSHAVI